MALLCTIRHHSFATVSDMVPVMKQINSNENTKSWGISCLHMLRIAESQYDRARRDFDVILPVPHQGLKNLYAARVVNHSGCSDLSEAAIS